MNPRGRWRRWLVAVLWIAVVLAALVALTPLDEVVVASVAGHAAGVELEIGKIEWPLFGRLEVREVEARWPTASEPFLTVASAKCDVGWFPPRIVTAVIERPRLVATEYADGTLDLDSLRQEPAKGGGGELPTVTLRDGAAELRGDGPLHRLLRGVVAADVPAKVAIAELTLVPKPGGLAVIRGGGTLFDLLSLEVEAALQAGTLASAEARVDPRAPLDFAALRARFAAPIAQWLEKNALTGRASGAIRVASAAAGSDLAIVAELDLEGLGLIPEVFPAPITGLTGRVTWRDGALVIEGLHGACGDAALSIHGRVDDLAGAAATRVVAAFERATLDDAMRAACRTDAIGRMMLEAFEPEGRWNCTATVVAGRDRDFRLELDIGLDELSGCFRGFLDEEGRRHGFPMRFERVHGRVVAAPDRSWFRDVVGFTRYGGSARASGEILGVTVTGDVEGDQLRIDDELLAAVESELGPALPSLVRELGLAGTFATVARYALDAEENFTLTLALTPRAITLAPAAFPLAAVLDVGHVHVDDTGIRIEGLCGRVGGGTLRIDGEIGLADDPPFEVRVAARGVEWGREALAACRAAGGEALARQLEELDPAGRFDVDLVIAHAAAGAPSVTTVTVRPRGVDLTLAASLRATAIEGAFVLTLLGAEPPRFDLGPGGLRGRRGGGAIALLPAATPGGLWRAEAGAIAIDDAFVAMVAPALPKVAELLREHQVRGHLRGIGAIDPGDRDRAPALAWVELAPDRALDAPSSEPPVIVAQPPWLPLPLEWRSGSMHIDAPTGEVMFGRLEGRLGDARAIVGGGSFTPTAGGLEARLDMQLDGLPFSEFLALVLGDARARSMDTFGPIGKARAEIQELTFTLGDGGDALRSLSARGLLDAHGFSFYAGGALREVTGRLHVESLAFERRADGGDSLRAEGELSRVTFQLGDQRFTSLDAELVLQDGRLSIPWLAADFAGGRLPREKNHFALELAGAMPFEGRLEVVAADISRVLGDDVPSMKSLVGRVDASVGLRGGAGTLLRDGEVTALEAGGSVRIADAKLWSIPVFDVLYSQAVLPLIGLEWGGPTEPPRWTRGAIDFALQGIVLQLSKIELEGEPLILRGTGTLGPERLRLDLYPEVRTGLGFVRDFPRVGWVADLVFSLLEKQVGAFVVVGAYGSPEVVWNPVSLPRDEFDIEFERPRTSPRRSRTPAERF